MHEWVAEAEGRVVVVLGAGASVPGGLPVSKDLTDLVIAGIDQQSRAPEAWTFVRDRLNLTSLDIEQLYRSIGDLRQVLVLPEWRALVDVPGSVEAKALADLQFDILDWTTTTLRDRSANADTTYLNALVNADVLGIVTLNFDTLVESAALQCDASISTGVDHWDGGFHWPSSADATPLLKLHGSLNWYQELRKAGPIPIGGYRTLTREDEYRFGGGGVFSDLRFGAENKLTQAGAMPALFEAFIDLLERSSLVIAVGYSFRDSHVDVALDRWAALDDSRRLLVVDPGRLPDDLAGLEASGSDWFGHMIAGLRHDLWAGRPERVQVLAESAGTAFGQLFGP
ncbi:SIR2 family protein [Microbacterium sp. NPDC076895]|uniref:SIR2 family protein n=1 Tax=Microbacterium sp. NPDC076895 TaxID=3154957 RepID=UPI003425CCFC